MSSTTNKKRMAQVFAWLALLGIILSIVGTGILVLTSPSQDSTHQGVETVINQEKLQEIIDASKTSSGNLTPTITVDGVEVNAEITDSTTNK